MKIASLIARYLLTLIFLVFGMNHYLNFIPTGPMPDWHRRPVLWRAHGLALSLCRCIF